MRPFLLRIYMKKILVLLFITFQFSVFSQVEIKYNANAENLPTWIQLMYADNPDEGAVINAYTDYYKNYEEYLNYLFYSFKLFS